MQKSYWGRDMAYVFSIHRVVLWTFGSWPLQGGFIFPLIRWILITTLELSLAVPSLVDFFVTHDSPEATLENLLYVECTILAVAKNIFPRIYLNKLAKNLRSAADDWSYALDHQEFYCTMKKFARRGRLLTLTLFNSAYWATCIFYLSIVFKSETQIESPDDVRKSITNKKNYLVSFSWMSDYVDNSMFVAIFIGQIVQTLVVGLRQSAVDSFFFNIVIHLCGQLEVLGLRFGNLGRNHRSIRQYQKDLGRLVRRHCELMELLENIEKAFNIIILLQILMSVVLIGMTGFQIVVALGTDDKMLILRHVLVMVYLLLQSLLYTHAGDLLQKHSEQIFFSVYGVSWYNLSPKASKDLQFVLIRANVPFRITGGKFIHISCKTMMNILKAAASYISVLSVTMKN